jgi:hypothetical protein
MEFYDRWNEFVRQVAGRLAPALKRYGWERDDAAQQASLKLIRVANSPRLLAMTDDTCLRKVLTALTRRHVFRAAGIRKRVLLPAEQVVLESAEARGDGWAAEFWTDILRDAPAKVAAYLRVTVFEMREWTGSRSVKESAARWVAKQLEVA